MTRVGSRLDRAQGGFTMVELMIVIWISAIMASITAVAIRQGSASFALRRAASLAVSEIRRAQSSAIAERRDFVVEFGFGASAGVTTYRFTDPPGSTWQQVRSIRAPSTGLDGSWPALVTFVTTGTTLSGCGGGALPGVGSDRCLKFGMFGEPTSPAAAGQVVLRNSSGTQLRVVVMPATGQVTVTR